MANQGIQLGQWVKAQRTALGMTQEQIAIRMEMDVDPNTIAQLESGRKKALPDTEFLIGLSQALRVSMTEVLQGAGVLPVYTSEITSEDERLKPILDLIRHVDWTDDRIGYVTDVLNGLIRRSGN